MYFYRCLCRIVVTHLVAGLFSLFMVSGSWAASAAPLLVGAVFSSAQQDYQSSLRFFNTGTTAGEKVRVVAKHLDAGLST